MEILEIPQELVYSLHSLIWDAQTLYLLSKWSNYNEKLQVLLTKCCSE